MEASWSRFTAAEGGARLATAAASRNTLAVEYFSFISTRLLYEDAYKIRGPLSEGKQRSVYITRSPRVPVIAHELRSLTELNVAEAVTWGCNWQNQLEETQVLVCTSLVLKHVLEEGILTMANINVLVIDSCHLVAKDDNLQFIMKCYKICKEDRPRILALTYPLFSSIKKEDSTKDTDKENSTNLEVSKTPDDGSTEKPPDLVEIQDGAGEPPKDDKEENLEQEDQSPEHSPLKKAPQNVNEIGVYENLDDFNMYEMLEWKIEELERELCCQMDLAEDIDSGKRLSTTLTKPKELIIEYSCQPHIDELPEDYRDLEKFMRDAVNDAMEFINEHRYDPTEIYGEDLYEEFMNIPDPTIEPKDIFKQFIYVLDQLGPYGADKAAFSLLTQLEKLKIKVPYERHFLLLCLCTSVFVKIRCHTDQVFSKFESEWEKIKTFSTPKVLRFAEILQQFQPPDLKDCNKKDTNENQSNEDKSNENENQINENKNQINESNENQNTSRKTRTNSMLEAIERCDFMSLSNKIEDRVNTYEANLKDLNDDIEKLNINAVNDENKINENGIRNNENKNDSDSLNDQKSLFPRRTGHRARGRGRVQRNNAARAQQMLQNPDALCGIVFMKETLMAKIMFMLIVDMSRSNAQLSFLCAQYCAAEPAAERAECQRLRRKQEDVLKKFRMHECNLLLATSALEEGIDLPRCNLVLRWDIPASYRSFGLCRGRARAARAACAVLARADGRATGTVARHLAVYRELDQIITRKCGCGIQDEPPQLEEDHADCFTPLIKPYTPLDNAVGQIKQNNENCDNEKLKTTNIPNNENVNNEHLSNENVNNDSRNSINDSDNVINENIFCNKCNSKRNSADVECPCVIIDKNVINDNNLINDNNVITDNNLINDNSVINDDNVINDKNVIEENKSDYVVKNEDSIASVDLSTAIALINRYCGKLPSDTFTRLSPQWWCEEVQLAGSRAFVCTLRLPLNCPVKYNIVGHPMPTRVLARRMVALQACRILHKSGELDNQLMPIGKENFKAAELENSPGNSCDPDTSDVARPGTTKRRQYYFKRTAWTFTDCQPVLDTSDSEIDLPKDKELLSEEPSNIVKTGTKRNMLYAIVSRLWCALPERYNTRGRRLHAPQHARQALGILMARDGPADLQIPAFPVYTRSGEVRVSVEYVPDADVRMSPRRGRLVRRFMRFVFAEVLRVRRRGMKLQSEGSTHNNYYIVPTVKTTRQDGSSKIDIDWAFLELIYQHTEEKKLSAVDKPALWHEDDDDPPEDTAQKEKDKQNKVKKMENPLLKEGETFLFDAEKYREAVVTPWYRNQDQPQFFLVAEICWNLTPDSAFPSASHTSFRHYYSSKYGVILTQSEQPLLDVDHTSARLNLLTPRYVNRKGVALPVSSERTRRAKRDRLDQKQILVPELCRVHPFAAPLWFATVALPCVLYRINALLIADEIRRAVAIDVGLGIPKIDESTCPGFKWPPLDFGWSLAEVLSADSEKEKKKDEEECSKKEEIELREKEETEDTQPEEEKQKTINDILHEKECADVGFEIGTWSNDMASSIPQSEYDEYMEPLPSNLTFCTSASGGTNWCDPIEKPKSHFNPSRNYSMADSDCSYMSSDFDTDDSDLNSEDDDEDTDASGFCCSKNSNAAMGVRIEYKTAHEAEAVDVERKKKINPAPQPDEEDDALDRREHEEFIKDGEAPTEYIEKFHNSVNVHEKEILEKHLIKQNEVIQGILPEIKESEKPSTIDEINRQLVKLKIIKNEGVKENDGVLVDNEGVLVDNEGVLVDNVGILVDNEGILVDNEVKFEIEGVKPENQKVKDEQIEANSNISVTNNAILHKINQNEIVKENEGVKDDQLEANSNMFVNNDAKLQVNDETKHLKASNEDLESNAKESQNDDKEIDEKAIKIKTEWKIDKIEHKNEQELAIEIYSETNLLKEIFPYGMKEIEIKNGQICLESIERNKRVLLSELKKTLSKEEIKKLNCFSMKDVNIDSPDYVNEKVVNVGFDTKENYVEKINSWSDENFEPYFMDSKGQDKEFDFDYQPDLQGHPGPSPSVILQGLTMSNANDGINLERLETIGDSFLKFAITAYLYCAHPTVHEGKLSHMRSKQVSNLNLYRLGRNKRLGARMTASKFEPHDNWLPPCHRAPNTLHTRHNGDSQEQGPTEAPTDNGGCFIPYNLITQHSIPDKSIADCVEALIGAYLLECGPRGALLFMSWLGIRVLPRHLVALASDHPYVVAASRDEKQDVVKTLKPKSSPAPKRKSEVSDSDTECSSDDDEWRNCEDLTPEADWSWKGRPVGSLRPYRDESGEWVQPIFGELKAPPSPLLRYIEDPEGELERMLSGYDALERTLQYRFKDRSLLLQALTHASHQQNRLTDCYQRLEFLGDAILDYLITRHLYEDPRRHSPGALTDLRSALVNNTIFATLAARHGFHKYFRHMSPGLNEVLTRYVKIQEENGHSISEEHYLIQEDEMEQAEDVEVPKALGDLFESVAGAIFLDSGMSLGAVWKSYVNLMGAELEAFSAAAPKSPVRELLEAEPDTAKFGKPERLADGRRVRVCVEVFGRGTFKGVGRNYRIAKGTAARCALRHLRAYKQR